MGSKRYCAKAKKSIFPDELTAKIWAANQKYDEDSEPYRDPRCGHIHLRTIEKRKKKRNIKARARWREKRANNA